MSRQDSLRSEIKVIVFDVYDTLLDREKTLVPAISKLLGADMSDAEPEIFLRRYLAMHFRNSLIDSLIPTPHTPFKEISRVALKYRLEQASKEHTDADVRSFVRKWNDLTPYPLVEQELKRLSECYELVGLSNGDPDMLKAVSDNFDVSFTAMHSVAKAGAYKPHPAPYQLVLEQHDIAPQEGLFITSHTFDLVGAAAIGMKGGYLNRHNNPFGDWVFQPDISTDSLESLVEILV